MTFMSDIINFAQNLVMRRRVLAPFRTDSFELCIGEKSTSMFELINLNISIGWLVDCSKKRKIFAFGMKFDMVKQLTHCWFKVDFLHKNYALT